MKVTGISNQQRKIVRNRLEEIYKHERAHKAKGGNLTGPIVIDWKDGIPVGGHVSIKMPSFNPKNPKKTIEEANTVINSAMAPSEPSSQDYKVAGQAKSVKSQAESLQIKKQNSGVDYYA